MSIIKFHVHGVPVAKGSRRAFVNKSTGKAFTAPSSDKEKPWQNTVAQCAMVARSQCGLVEPMHGPVRLWLSFTFMRPKSHMGSGKNANVVKASHLSSWHTSKPDLDKLIRAIKDSLTGILYADDSQVAVVCASKQFVTDRPGVTIEVGAPTQYWSDEVLGKVAV